MRLYKHTVCCIAIMVSLFVVMIAGCSKKAEDIPDDAQYCIVFSDIMSKRGKYFFIDDEGSRVGEATRLNYQDLNEYDVTENTIIFSGQRRNNSLIISRGSSEFKKDFLFLDDDLATGITAVKLRGDSVIATVNGGFTETSYTNFLVWQSLDGDVLQDTTLEIFAESMFDKGEYVVIGGQHKYIDVDEPNNHEEAWIIVCNIDGKGDFVQYEYPEYSNFHAIAENSENYLLIADTFYDPDTLVTIDKESFELKSAVTLDDELTSLITHDDKTYAVGDNGVYEVDFSGSDIEYELKLKFSELGLEEDCVDFGYELNDKGYVFMRNYPVIEGEGENEYGYMLEIDFDSFDVKKTPIRCPDSDFMENIYIFPADFIRKD